MSINQKRRLIGVAYGQYFDSIYRYCSYRISPKEECEDIVQNTFYRLFIYLSRPGARVDDFKALAYKTARNLIIDSYRSRRRNLQQSYEALYQALGSAVEPSVDGREKIETNIYLAETVAGFSDLSEGQKEAVRLHLIDGLSIGEAARSLGCSKSTVSARLYRARKKLRESRA